ncbi:MAG: hypothetical protein CVU11_06345 [Bacteroidetes bacterium HGW-Bacteroidetes-6]|jgi:hypothetical protein|nr:MAG: hypothetical protein CVU11_06345 [Bacteroidetes bacterium HGW-Bacteroidetes-6]
MGFVSGYPLWLVVVCVAIALAYSLTLYTGRKAKRFKRGYRIAMFSFRFVVVFLLTFFLLEPLIRLNLKVTNKPVLVVATDNSLSMVSGTDSAYIRNNFPAILNEWIASTGEEPEIVRYNFSDSLASGPSTDFSGKLTDIGNVFQELRTRYINKNLIGIVLVSDGINNAGINPLSAAGQIQAPVFCVPLGDSSTRTDVAVASLTGNREVVFNNYFPIEFGVNATQADGKTLSLKVTHNDKEILNQQLDIQGNQFSRLFNIKGFATQKGLNRIVVSVSSLPGEQNVVNNQRVFYFNVADDVKKVLIVAAAPHPDINAIRKTLEGNLNYDVKVVTGESNAGDISGYDLLILHQIPSRGARNSIMLDKAMHTRIPVWIITGAQTNFAALNALNAGVTVRVRGSSVNEVTAVANEGFGLFTLPQQEAAYVKSMPPLTAPFGDYSVAAGVDVLLYQKIGSVVSSQPLLCISQVQNQRWAFLLAENIWRWRLYDFQRNNSFGLFDSFVSRIAQYLSQNSDRSRFRVIYEPTHSEMEPVRFAAELYNSNYELINSEPVDMLMKDNTGHEYRYSFVPDGSGYSLNCGKLSTGEYSFTAQVKSKQYSYSQSGKITVDRYNPELASLKADFNLLQQLAIQSGGLMVSPDSLSNINRFLEQENRIQSTYYRQNKYIDLLDWKWLLIIILALVSAEWIIRKREGYY